MVWIPKNIKVSNSNPQGPKMKWVPKCPPINSSMHKISQKKGQIGLAIGRYQGEFFQGLMVRVYAKEKKRFQPNLLKSIMENFKSSKLNKRSNG